MNNEVHHKITKHFCNHFQKPALEHVDRFTCLPSPMQNPISTDEVSLATAKMTNNRAADHVNICAELVKYAPKDIHTEIAETLNDLIEKQHQIDIGKGILVPLEKPLKRMPGPVKNLRPITLLPTIRKIMSKITLSRLKPNFDQYLSASQSAYRSNRSTTDIVSSYRWILAKVQVYDIEVYSTGIDMSAAFNSIDIVQLIKYPRSLCILWRNENGQAVV